MAQALLDQARPVADAWEKHTPMDKIKRWLRSRERPTALGVCDHKAAIRRSGIRSRVRDVDAEDLSLRMLRCESDGPAAVTAANVNNALADVSGQGGAVEAMVLDEPHAMLKVCGIQVSRLVNSSGISAVKTKG